MPVIKTQEYIKGLSPGDEFEVIATDPGVLWDIPAWCRVHGHTVLSQSEQEDEIRVHIRV